MSIDPLEPFDDLPVEPAPILERLNALGPEAQAAMAQEWKVNAWPSPAEMSWHQIREIVTELRVHEPMAERADRERTIAKILVHPGNPLKREVAERICANYAIRAGSPFLTEGDLATIEWIATNMAHHWEHLDIADGATEVTGRVATFDEAVADATQAERATVVANAMVTAAASAPKGEDPPAPADWDAEVPHGTIGAIMDWVEATEDPERRRIRAHKALIAEIRRRGDRQRSSLIKKMQAQIPDGWTPPYLRTDAAALPSPVSLAEGTTLMIAISADGTVTYWTEGGDD
ncbi:MAG: hypothetical protein D6683_09525 [Actinomyces sp.]|nr:MAG: hypothetical protein D6683_09525 [Actinomyces sp.]